MSVRNLPFYLLSRVGFYKEIKVGRTDSNNIWSPVYYIIRRTLRWRDAGFFSNYFFVLSHYAYALHWNWSPVVDMRNYTTRYSERQPVEGERNAWNYFLRQPFKTRDAYRNGRFVLSEARLPAMSGWDLYLSTVYGDYMTSPPPEKRKSMHRFQTWWKE